MESQCIYCGMVICTIPGDEFTPHFKKDGHFKCRQCGPFTNADLQSNSPFAIRQNDVLFAMPNGVQNTKLTDQQLLSLCRHSIVEGGE